MEDYFKIHKIFGAIPLYVLFLQLKLLIYGLEICLDIADTLLDLIVLIWLITKGLDRDVE
jgi:hypothetical protein